MYSQCNDRLDGSLSLFPYLLNTCPATVAQRDDKGSTLTAERHNGGVCKPPYRNNDGFSFYLEQFEGPSTDPISDGDGRPIGPIRFDALLYEDELCPAGSPLINSPPRSCTRTTIQIVTANCSTSLSKSREKHIRLKVNRISNLNKLLLCRFSKSVEMLITYC